MFERYTEHARRVIFFARYEASIFGSAWIETEHMLLGLIREDKVLPARLPKGAGESIRKQIEAGLQHPIEQTSTSMDLPLSMESKRALAYGAEEAERLQHKFIDSGHLVLGLLRMEKCAAAVYLQQFGIEADTYRDVVSSSLASAASPGRAIERPSAWHQEEALPCEAPSLKEPIAKLQQLVDGTVEHLAAYSAAYGEQHLKRKHWSRKEAFGHLLDCATVHRQWLVRALIEPTLVAPGYPLDAWVSVQDYAHFDWRELVDLWVGANRLLIHVLARIPESKLDTPCRIGVEEAIPLSKLIARYVEHAEDLVGQILARL